MPDARDPQSRLVPQMIKDYGSLPDIDLASPFTFETPSTDQITLAPEEPSRNADIDTQSVSLADARSQFQAKEIITAQGESFQERYTRLATQIDLLRIEADQSKQVDLLGLCSKLSRKLLECGEVNTDGGMFAMLNKVKEAKNATTMSTAINRSNSKSGDKGHMVYELQISPSLLAHAENTRLDQLETRISKIEKVLGIYDTDPLEGSHGKILGKSAVIGSIASTVRRVEAHMHMLASPGVLESAQRKFKTTLDMYQQLETKKLQVDECKCFTVEQAEKIDQMYTLMKQLEPVTPIVPQLIDRLSTLQSLHAQQAEYTQYLHSVCKTSESAQEILDTLKQAQESLAKTIKENMSQTTTNLAFMNSAAVQS